ncbi:MAG: glycoside hydrolase family 57 protein [Candidatus Brockarchaeota archaeon]|nr:glycoside hydrolase family 57 protein [Candidatus Brockarchaeota archaeon]
MKGVVLCFESHQPYRIRQRIIEQVASKQIVRFRDLEKIYFDDELNKQIFKRVSERCYLPASEVLLDIIDKQKSDARGLRVAFSLSGLFIEQARQYDERVLQAFKDLSETGRVEFLAQTYYHSLVSLYSEDRPEFIEQVEKHVDAVSEEFNQKPTVFENTELIYNNSIARTVEKMGFKAIFTEGVERILGWRSPNYVYSPKGAPGLRLLLRNYRLTDDIGFRFSSTRWEQYPLTAEKYASWLAATPGDCINIFMDYETFGEHHWKETGIFDFLRALPEKVLEYQNLCFMLPSEVVDRFDSKDEIDVFELGGTVSWADEEKDLTAWLQNPMQNFLFERIKALEPIVKAVGDSDALELWRRFTTSDYYYYLSTKTGGAGEVHNYFNPYPNPLNAYNNIMEALLDFELRVRRAYNRKTREKKAAH